MFSGYVKSRRGILEHLRSGSVTKDEYTIFDILVKIADPGTGIWIGSAKAIAGNFNFSVRQSRKVLEGLERKGYVKRFTKPGKHTNYPILINKYEVTQGSKQGTRLNAAATIDYDYPVYDSCQQECEGGGQRGGQHGASKREKRIEKEKEKKTNPPSVVFRCEFFEVEEELHKALEEAYPAVDLIREYKKARAWVLSTGRRYKKYGRFLRNWIDNASKGYKFAERASPESAVGRGPQPESKPGSCSECGTEIPAGFLKCLKCMKKKAPVNP